MFKVLDTPYLPGTDSFIVGPFHAISDILIEKKTDETNFESIITFLIDYFKNIKEHRTIDNVDDVLNDLFEKYDLSSIKGLKETHKDMNIRDLGKKLENFLEDNGEEIETLAYDSKTGPFVMSWVLNLDEAMRILLEFLDKCGTTQKYNKRKHSKRDFEDSLYTLIKAVFLVFFRMVEQMYQIINGIPHDVELEKQYLIEDIVYLENIQKSVIYDLLK